jgi:hypothetical protein
MKSARAMTPPNPEEMRSKSRPRRIVTSSIRLLYEAVGRLRAAPIGKQSVITVVAAAIVPMLPVIAIQVPIKDQLLSMIKILL